MKTILIVEDNAADQFLGQAIISAKRPDVKVTVASDGEEALEILRSDDSLPDLILLDINMPRMNGHDFLEVFSENNTRDIPVVVMMTSSDLEQDREKSLSYKCVKDYLLKPVKPETIDLLETIVKKYTDC